MTATLELPAKLRRLPVGQVDELACRASLGVWTARKRKLEMAPFHWEWCALAQTETRMCVLAPREHAKTETFTSNATVWRSAKYMGIWSYIFCDTKEQSIKLLKRVVEVAEETEPWLLDDAQISSRFVRFSNGSRVSTAGAGMAVRGGHPDIIIGDDVLEEQKCLTEMQRKKTDRWWRGTVTGMAHPGTTRRVRPAPNMPYVMVRMPPTKIFLVGTPFHSQDLLMSMKNNQMYRFRRYAAEYRSADLVPGTWAVEAS